MNKRQQGFTLIEMAVVLVVIGLLLAVALPFFTERLTQEKIIEGRGNISALKREIIGFALTNGYLPELADVEAMANSIDSWDNPVAYWSDPDITGSANPICNYDTPPGNLQIDQVIDTSTTNSYTDVAFAISSRGLNFNLQAGYATGPPVVVTTYPVQYAPDNIPDNFDDVAHETVNSDFSGSAREYDVSGTREEPYDDIFEFVSFNYLRDRLGCTNEDLQPTNAAITFDDIGTDFGKAGTSGSSNYTANVETAIVIDEANGEIRLGNDSDDTRGCIWYNGTNATIGCTKVGDVTVCSSPNWTELISVFKFAFLNPDDGADSEEFMGGFVYAIISATNGDINRTGSPCGGGSGNDGYLGYANSGASRIQPPKFGVEVDVYPNGTNSAATRGAVDDQYDPLAGDDDPFNGTFAATLNHVAAVFWSGDTLPETGDNQHGETADAGAGDIANPFFTAEPDNNGFMTNSTQVGPGNDNWLEDAQEHWIRIVLQRNNTPISGGPNDGQYEYKTRIYIDDTPSANFLDVGTDFTDLQINAEYAEETTVYLEQEEHDEMDNFRFGWTMAVNTDGDLTFTPDPQSSAISSFGFNIITP